MNITLFNSLHKFNLDCQDPALLLDYKYYPRMALSVSSPFQQPQFLKITSRTQSLRRKPQVFPKEMYLTLSTFPTPTSPTKHSPYTSSTHQKLKKLSSYRSELIVGESSNIIFLPCVMHTQVFGSNFQWKKSFILIF